MPKEINFRKQEQRVNFERAPADYMSGDDPYGGKALARKLLDQMRENLAREETKSRGKKEQGA